MRYNLTSYPSRECNDCTVRALAAAAGISYNVARLVMAGVGRPKGEGIAFPATVRNRKFAGLEFQWVIDRLGIKAPKQYITLKQFCKKYRTGTYLVCKRSHALAVRNGIVIDANKTGPRARITHAWIVTQNNFELSTNVR